MNKMPFKYSVVIPVYNEEGNIVPLLQEISDAMKPLGEPFELVVVDDGSTDNSLSEIKMRLLQYPMLRVVEFERNSGQSAAFDAGIRASAGEVIITIDADLQNDPKDIPLLLEKLSEVDAVVGWRRKRKDSILKRITSRVGNFVRNLLTRENIADTGCSLKAFKREAIQRVKLFRGLHRFLPTLLKMEGFSVAQVKVNHRPRVKGKTKYGFFDRFAETVFDVLAIRWMQKRALNYRVKHVAAGEENELRRGGLRI